MSQNNETQLHIEHIENKSENVESSLNYRLDKLLEKFELSQKTLKEFRKFQSQKEISELREEIQLSANIPEKEKVYINQEVSDQELSNILETAQEIHFEAAENKNSLLEELNNNSEIRLLSENKNLLRKIWVSDKMMEAAYNPKNAYEHVLWWVIGCSATLWNCAITAFHITKWVINTPRDIYLILKWKATYTPKWNI